MNVLFLIPLLMLYVYKCAVRTEEGWHKNIITLWRWTKTFSGARDRVARKDGKLVPGTNRRKIRWILFGPQWVSRYKFPWVQGMSTDEMTKKGIEKDAVVWGNPDEDAEVAVQRNEWTRRHRDQFDYLFKIKDLETGEKLRDGANAAKDGNDQIEYIKILSLLNATVKMDTPWKAEFREGGATWYTSLNATLTGFLGEIISDTVLADLPVLRGDGLKNALVKNRYASVFKTAKGKVRKMITFLEAVNHEMLVVKDLGVFLTHITLMDFEVAPEYQPYLTELQGRAVAKVRLDIATYNAKALKASLVVKQEFVKAIVKGKTDQEIRLKSTIDPNVKEKYSHLNNLRMYSEGSTAGATAPGLDFNKIVDTAIALDVASDLDPILAEAKKPAKNTGNQQNQNQQNQNQQNKGGKK